MITVEYKCDRCGKTQPTSDQFWTIGVGATHGPQVVTRVDRTIHVCRVCLEALGYHVKAAAATSPPPPTIEELIRQVLELVQE